VVGEPAVTVWLDGDAEMEKSLTVVEVTVRDTVVLWVW
jgi:hypothetical protein